MNKEEPYRDQAERLKQRIDKVTAVEDVGESGKLPPREQVHRKRKKKTKWKLKYPVIRLLVLCFILLPLIIFSVISYHDNNKKIGGTEKTSGSSVGYEEINIDDSSDENENQPEEMQKKDAELEKDNTVDQPNQETTDTEQNSSNEDADQTSDNQSSSTESNNNLQDEAVKKQVVASSVEKRIVYHTVQAQETLYKLAIKYYQSKNGINLIKEANHLANDSIHEGQVLKIPLNEQPTK